MDLSVVESLFAARGFEPAGFQRACWAAWRAGASGLVNAPTGSGKTLALWGGPLALAAKTPPDTLKILWITPLRALAGDTTAHLQTALDEIGSDLLVARRTGDSTSGERARYRRRTPFALVTTPESLSLLLSYQEEQARLRHLDAVIVDEWHELMGNKRGVQLELCLARLRRLAPGLKIWGSSATLGNVKQAAQVLAGNNALVIAAEQQKAIAVESLRPARIERFPWAGHLGLKQLPGVLASILRAGSALVFTNTRSQAELWFEALQAVWPLEPQMLALHHGSLDRNARLAVEDALRLGTVRCVVATSTLDLGVDFPAVNAVIQIGSPKGVGRVIQRAGRSGHRPGEMSRITFVATQALEFLEIAAARRALASSEIEARVPRRLCFDVLAQHLVTLALGGGFVRDHTLTEIRTTHAYADLSESSFDRVLDVVVRGGDKLAQYPDFQRVVCTDDRFLVPSAAIARRHRWSIGTIVADGQMQVRFVRGAVLGMVEESFISRLRPGARFLFAGRTLELVRVRDMVAQVKVAGARGAAVPQWMGGKMPLSSHLASGVLALIDQRPDEPEVTLVAPLLDMQAERSALPSQHHLLVEKLRTRDGHHLAVFPFAGRHAHEGLAPLLAYRLKAIARSSYSYTVNDYGVLLSSRHRIDVDTSMLRQLLSPKRLIEDIEASVNLAEMARRQFRDVAQIAGLTFNGTPGQSRPLRQLQASSGLLFDVLEEHDPEHLLLQQARQEVLIHCLDVERLEAALQCAQQRPIVITEPRQPTPFSFPLWAERLRGRLSHEDWQTRVRAAADAMERHG